MTISQIAWHVVVYSYSRHCAGLGYPIAGTLTAAGSGHGNGDCLSYIDATGNDCK